MAFEYGKANPKTVPPEPIDFPSASVPYSSPYEVVFRDGRLQRDNGECQSPTNVYFFSDEPPDRVADCKQNEVDVPNLVGMPISQARARLISQPLTPDVITKPASPGQRLDVVIGQIPAKGRLSAYDQVKLVLPKPTAGVVPRLVGLSLERAQAKLERKGLEYEVQEVDGKQPGRVIFQVPRPRVAAEKGMVVRLAVVKAG